MLEVTLDGMPPIKKPRKRVLKKHHTTKNVPIEISVRRQVAEEIGDAEPTKDQKFILLQKYGATAPRIDRLATKPNWMGVVEWKRKQNDWFKATKGLVRPEQRRFSRPNSNSQPLYKKQFSPPSQATVEARSPRPYQKPWNQNHKARRPDTRTFPRNSGPEKTESLPS